ncbi:Transcription and mRNA export factor eny2 [Allomyces arbusculus]|nr:Transcription and mRNA export factor eny2 [Allomyces arbusculus]
MDRQSLYQKLMASGERDLVKEQLRAQLAECGWRDQVRAKIREAIERDGIDKVSVESLVHQIVPAAQELVPDRVRQDLCQRVQAALGPAAGGAK